MGILFLLIGMSFTFLAGILTKKLHDSIRDNNQQDVADWALPIIDLAMGFYFIVSAVGLMS